MFLYRCAGGRGCVSVCRRFHHHWYFRDSIHCSRIDFRSVHLIHFHLHICSCVRSFYLFCDNSIIFFGVCYVLLLLVGALYFRHRIPKFLLEWMHYYRILGGIIILFAIKQRSTNRLFDSFFFVSFIRSFDAFLCTSFFTDTFDLWNDWFECVCHCAVPVMYNESDRKAKAKAVAPVFTPHSHSLSQYRPAKQCYLLSVVSHLQFIEYDISHGMRFALSVVAFNWWWFSFLFLKLSIFTWFNNAAYRLIWMLCFSLICSAKKAISSEILMNIEQWDERLNDMDAISEHNGISFNGNNDCTSQRLWIFCVIKLGKQNLKPSLKGIYVVWAKWIPYGFSSEWLQCID